MLNNCEMDNDLYKKLIERFDKFEKKLDKMINRLIDDTTIVTIVNKKILLTDKSLTYQRSI